MQKAFLTEEVRLSQRRGTDRRGEALFEAVAGAESLLAERPQQRPHGDGLSRRSWVNEFRSLECTKHSGGRTAIVLHMYLFSEQRFLCIDQIDPKHLFSATWRICSNNHYKVYPSIMA